MSRYVPAGSLEGDARWRPFPEGQCQWCGKELPRRCKSFCAPVDHEYYPGHYQKVSWCRIYYWEYWYTSPRARRLILLRDGFTCQNCTLRPTKVWEDGITRPDLSKLHVDHIIPYSKGGRSDPANLQVLCAILQSGQGIRDASSGGHRRGDNTERP